MTDKFNGFSQDEINRVSGQKVTKKNLIENNMKPATLRGHGGIRRMPDKCENQRTVSQSKAQSNVISNKRVTSDKLQKMETNDSMEDIDLDGSMSKSIEEALFFQTQKKTSQPNSIEKAPTTMPIPSKSPITSRQKSSDTPRGTNLQRSSNDSSILKLNLENESRISSTSSSGLDDDDSSILSSCVSNKTTPYVPPSTLEAQSPFKGISLKDFETHRKMIEEQNRQKKDLLYKVIEQHSQKTAAEARKIEEIKAELSKLDNDLAVDVAVLRKQIESACIHFANIEKNYLKIEAQFLKAKIELHNAAEKKELLTEHLCTVIAHNEDRKAQKLTELMEKVGLSAGNCEEYEAPSSTSK
ncbi:golgin, RAB6 interacting [Haematobia irritans]|uniref:golgin, RAB6 interacting n=1 Tax=Haematobia irritans TaxID=7368 RepID=UPI003F50BCCE